MAQSPAYQQLAKEFMDLWQKQISAVISDKQFIQSMLDLFKSVQAPSSNEEKSTPAPAHTANTPDVSPGMLAELSFRIAMCEKRIALLEESQYTGHGRNNPAAGAFGKRPARRSKKPHK